MTNTVFFGIDVETGDEDALAGAIENAKERMAVIAAKAPLISNAEQVEFEQLDAEIKGAYAAADAWDEAWDEAYEALDPEIKEAYEALDAEIKEAWDELMGDSAL